MPVPRLMSHDFWYCAKIPPDNAVMAPETQSPTVMVCFGLMLEAFTIAALSPVARIESPSLVPRKRLKRMPITTTRSATRIKRYQPPVTKASNAPSPIFSWIKSLAIVKMLSHLNRFRLEENPITAIFIV